MPRHGDASPARMIKASTTDGKLSRRLALAGWTRGRSNAHTGRQTTNGQRTHGAREREACSSCVHGSPNAARHGHPLMRRYDREAPDDGPSAQTVFARTEVMSWQAFTASEGTNHNCSAHLAPDQRADQSWEDVYQETADSTDMIRCHRHDVTGPIVFDAVRIVDDDSVSRSSSVLHDFLDYKNAMRRL